jgi:hypothetical protein
MSRFINNAYLSFISNLNGKCISNYFQITRYSCVLLRNSVMEFIVSIYSEQMKNYAFQQLPIELSIHISGYLYECINVSYKLVYPIDSPFKPPTWYLLYDKTNNSRINYEYVSHLLNKQYNVDWSPAISLEKTVLSLLECFVSLKN